MAEVRLEQLLPHPRERVWRALTEPELLSGWFMPTDLRPVPGSRFTIFAGTFPGFLGPVAGEVRQVVPRERLVTVWEGEKLHTRMVWELVSTEQGCRLLVVQSGFFGAPAELRARSLRATYGELFAERLPAVLDRLATGGVRRWTPPAPARRSPYRNAAAAIWDRGRRLGPAPPLPVPVRPGNGRLGMIRPAVPVRSLIDLPSGEPPPRRPAQRVSRATHGRWQSSVPTGWIRTATSTGAAALIVAAVLAALAYQPGGPGQPGGPAGSTYRQGPAMAVQPPWVVPTSTPVDATAPVTAGSDAPSTAGRPGEPRAPGASAPAPSSAGAGRGQRPPVDDPGDRFAAGGGSGSEPGGGDTDSGSDRLGGSAPPPGRTPEATPSLVSPSTAPLTADLTSTGLPLLGGRQVTVLVTNPGVTEAEEWEVVLDVSGQEVVDVTGAQYRREGDRVYFTPTTPLAAGEVGRVQFRIVAPLLGLLGATDPLACTIDGRPCR